MRHFSGAASGRTSRAETAESRRLGGRPLSQRQARVAAPTVQGNELADLVRLWRFGGELLEDGEGTLAVTGRALQACMRDPGLLRAFRLSPLLGDLARLAPRSKLLGGRRPGLEQPAVAGILRA